MVLYQFQQVGNEEFQSRKKIEKKNSKMQDAGKSGQWNSSRRRENSEFRYGIAKITVHSENFAFHYAL